MGSYVNWRNILTFLGVLFGISSGDFNHYNCKMTPGIQFSGNINKYKYQTSVIECVIFCLDSDKITLSADFCGDYCSCYSQTQNMANSVANSTCTGIQITQKQEFNNCYDIFKSFSIGNGIYNIKINGTAQDVYCDMDNGGWTVIQRRYDGSVDFNRSYQQYQDGFGTINGEYWLGLDKIHDMLSLSQYEVQFDLSDFNGIEAFAGYSNFTVSNSADNYKLEISGYNGNAGDGMAYHNGMDFSAGSVDNDIWISGTCAHIYPGGWWYKDCHHVNINGIYNNTEWAKGLNWFEWRGMQYSLKSTVIKIKPRQ